MSYFLMSADEDARIYGLIAWVEDLVGVTI